MATVKPARRSATPVRGSDGASLQSKFASAQRDMNSSLIELSDEIDLTLIGLLSQYHVLFVGAPGTAKSLLAETVRKWIEKATSLTIHCCKDTTRGAAFGPIDLPELAKGNQCRKMEGGAADSHVVIMEEVFKSGPAVLDMFLMLMNERIYKEGLIQRKALLKFMLGVSNEWSPEGCEAALSAFFDRFLIRKAVQPIRTKAGLDKLLAIPLVGQTAKVNRSHEPVMATTLTLAELDTAHEQVKQMRFTRPAYDAMHEIVKDLRDKEGINAGPRRLKQSVQAVQACAYLNQASEVEPEHLEVLKDILWIAPEQAEKAAKVVARIANPLSMEVAGLINQMESIVSTPQSVEDAKAKLDAIKRKLSTLRDHPRVDAAKETLTDNYRIVYARSTGRDLNNEELLADSADNQEYV